MADFALETVAGYATSFVGRERELAHVGELLERARLVTIVGPGGVGKTRLAREIARRFPSPDVAFVSLEGAHRGDPVFPQIAGALRLDVRSFADAEREATRVLRQRKTLVILDNCEQVTGSCAEACAGLLHDVGAISILATSREPLGVADEQVVMLGPLAQAEAIALFQDRSAVTTARRLRIHDVRDVAAIVERVDRLPLGIELAAGVARAPSALARARPARHRTLEAVVEWSFDQLSYDERTLFRRLAPFAGGWTLEAAIATAGFQPLQNEDVPGLLAVLANRSLVVVEAGGARYRMLETIAAYAAARLRGADDERIARDRHLAYFREAAEQWDARALREPWPAVLAAMTPELVNCSAALAWAFSDGHPADGARLISSLVILTAYGRVLPKADQWLARASECDLSDPGLRGRVEHAIAVQTMFDGAPREAIGHERLAVSALRESGDLPRLARALAVLARLLYNVDEAHEAIAVGGEALAIAAAHGLRPLEASILGNLDVHYRAVDERVTAAECSERARAICREIGDRHLFAAMTGNRSVALYEEGRYDEAVVLARQAVELAGALQDERFLAWQLMNVGSMEIRRHNFAAAREVLLRALPMNVACEDPVAVASTVLHLAEVALAASDARRALQLYACAEALRGDRFALQPNMAAIAERLRDRLNATFGDAVVAESVEAAPRAMSHALRLGELG